MTLQATLDFLAALRENNRREWFQEHREQYDEARAAFEGLVVDVIARFSSVDPEIGLLNPPDAMFRINRDVRFSKDKSPYKTNMSALIGPAGRKSSSRYYYISIEPGNQSMVASGLKSPDADALQTIREVIAENAQPLRRIVEAEPFKAVFGGLEGEQLKSAPKGYPKDHPSIDLLRYKEYLAARHFSDTEVAQPDFTDVIIETCIAARPLAMYLHGLISQEA